MKVFFLLSFLFAANVIVAEDTDDVTPVVIATKEELTSAISKQPQFVMFFAPWCGHCQRLKPVWEELSQSTEVTSLATIAQVDCTKTTKLCSDEGVTGYPTLKLYQAKKETRRHTGNRDLMTLKKFVTDAITSEEVADDDDVEVEDVEGLYDVTDGNLEKWLSGHEFGFVKFYAPWCGHCKRLEPTWKELAKNFISNSRIAVARVDCTKNRKVCQEHGVRGYPTLLLFKENQKIEDYSGSRDLKSLTNFINKNLDEPEVADDNEVDAEDVEGLYDVTDGNLEKWLSGHEFGFVKFYAPWCGHCKRLEPTWKELAKNFISNSRIAVARIDCTENPSSCSKHGVRGYPTLLLFKNGEKMEKYQQNRDLKSFEKFLNKKINPELESSDDDVIATETIPKQQIDHVHDVTDGNLEKWLSGHEFGFVKFYAPWCGHCKRLEPTWKELAKNFISNSRIAVARVDCTQNPAICQNQGVSGYPTLNLYQNGEKIEKYQGSREVDKLQKFVEDRISGKTPETKQGRGVLYLHEKNFDYNTATDVIIVLFYTPWCSFCQQLKPVWMDLANADFSKLRLPVKVGNVDCKKNHQTCEHYKISDFPTIMIFVEGIPRPKYTGSRELDDLKAYISAEVNRDVSADFKEDDVIGDSEPQQKEDDVIADVQQKDDDVTDDVQQQNDDVTDDVQNKKDEL